MSKNKLQISVLNKKDVTDFAKERNLILNKSKSDWVFFVDKDETVSALLRKEIDKVIEESGSRTAFYVVRKNYFLGQYVGTDKILRLIKKGSGVWTRAVHETFVTQGTMGKVSEPLIHNTAHDLKSYIAKIQKYSLIHAQENMSEGKKSSIFKIIFYPLGKFLLTYVKSRHVVFSIIQAFHSYLSWSTHYIYEHKTDI